MFRLFCGLVFLYSDRLCSYGALQFHVTRRHCALEVHFDEVTTPLISNEPATLSRFASGCAKPLGKNLFVK